MARKQHLPVKLTENFERNLETIEAFWSEREFPAGYDRLLDDLAETVIPNLEQFPAMGAPLLSRAATSVEAVSKQGQLQDQLARFTSGELREYLLQDYLVLYAHIDDTIYLLSIRHYRQLSFDFAHLWPGQH
ncbi:type II toxin-antitoxin system RelE/ParE family toxin [Ralstonia pseudosolanacearum]|uniref:type II toxin-antitoxin system RelE/ParE family toxin n=1 Tax=Ralstonia pseudosolanacearum TaxID=1310165 RepID=UPI000B92E390|nr:type II toxin-antitoxin system RelE/ParE family toxin [Ralstonia pseudosolanacearum]MCD9227663.1 type II toxin-antitoxin system RelE/ParE family toxin [Ralstonia pseudosolanacearum]